MVTIHHLRCLVVLTAGTREEGSVLTMRLPRRRAVASAILGPTPTEVSSMRLRGNVAIDLGTVNTLVWVAGRGLVLEEPSAIAIDTAAGSVAAVGSAADALADKEPQDIEVLHPLRDGVIADLDATAA